MTCNYSSGQLQIPMPLLLKKKKSCSTYLAKLLVYFLHSAQHLGIDFEILVDFYSVTIRKMQSSPLPEINDKSPHQNQSFQHKNTTGRLAYSSGLREKGRKYLRFKIYCCFLVVKRKTHPEVENGPILGTFVTMLSFLEHAVFSHLEGLNLHALKT